MFHDTRAIGADLFEASEAIDDANHTIFFDIVIDTLRKQGGLMWVLTFDESAHGLALNWKSVF
jgi:L-serine deaminase